MVLQRPVACEQHSASARTAGTQPAPANPPALAFPSAPASGPSADGPEGRRGPERPALFTHDEYVRLLALRRRIRRQQRGGGQPDDLPAPRSQPDDPDRGPF
jgi:hypothetical protein